MTRRRALLVVLLAASLALGGYAAWKHFFGLPAGVNLRGFEMIREGMTRQEVEAVLGQTPTQLDPPLSDGGQQAWWAWGEHSRLEVLFRPDGTVERATILSWRSPPASSLDRLRQWLGW